MILRDEILEQSDFVQYFKKKGLEQGIEQGLEKGREQGRAEASLRMLRLLAAKDREAALQILRRL